MISPTDVQRLIQRDRDGRDVMSLYLDMSVNSDNKRTHSVFLNKEKARFTELRSDRDNHHREDIGETFARVDRWLSETFDPSNRGVAIFAEVGGTAFDAFQFPTPLRNRIEVAGQPVIGPLSELVRGHRRYGVIIVDREHLRLVSFHMGVVGEDYTLSPDAIDTPHDVQAGGYSQKDYQKRKAEEARQFFKDFTEEIGRFTQRVKPDHLILLGTTENTQNFREFLPKQVHDRIIHTAHSPVSPSGPELVRFLEPVLDEITRREEAAAFNVLQDRVRQSHFATSGMHDTLVQLQEGKVERLVVARDLEKDGVQCTQCGFYLVRRDGACPYCGGSLRDGIDLVESMIRIAAAQEIAVEFAPTDAMRELNGVAALLKF
jgi:peptide subunit release factor 1 (eRF1)